MKIFSVAFAVMLALASPAWSTPIPRPQLFPEIPASQTEASVLSKRQGKDDLEPQGTFGLNVFASPLGGVYSGMGAMNPYSNGLGSIGTAYGVNQMNTLGTPGGYYGGAGGLGTLGAGLGAGGLGTLGAGLGAGGLGAFGSGLGAGAGGLGTGFGAMNPATLSGLGGFGGLGSYPSYPFGGGLINGALYSPVGMNFGLGQAGYPLAGYPGGIVG